AVSELFGDWGVGKLGGATAGRVGVKYLSPATSTAIVRCPRDNYRLVCAALAFLNAIPISKDASLALIIRSADVGGGARDRLPCVFQVVRVSGTIKKVEQEAIRRARRDVARLMAAGEGAGAAGQFDVLDQILGTTTAAKAGGDGAGDVVMGVDDDDEDGEGESDDE
ncbi:protein with putative role during mitosis, partial [Ascosphaera pollenicola]